MKTYNISNRRKRSAFHASRKQKGGFWRKLRTKIQPRLRIENESDNNHGVFRHSYTNMVSNPLNSNTIIPDGEYITPEDSDIIEMPFRKKPMHDDLNVSLDTNRVLPDEEEEEVSKQRNHNWKEIRVSINQKIRHNQLEIDAILDGNKYSELPYSDQTEVLRLNHENNQLRWALLDNFYVEHHWRKILLKLKDNQQKLNSLINNKTKLVDFNKDILTKMDSLFKENMKITEKLKNVF